MENGMHEDSTTEKDNDGLINGKWFEIHPANPEQASPSLEFTWCLSPALIARIKELKICFPFLFVIVAKEQKDEDGCITCEKIVQNLILLEQGGERIEFYEPGRYRIYATLVAEKYNESIKPATRKQLSIFLSNVPCRIVDSGIELHISIEAKQIVDAVEECRVMIPDEHFAKEPPAWLAWWVNLGFEEKPRNECFFRRRLMLAFSIQPPAIAIWIILRAMAGLVSALSLLLIGWRHISLKPLIHPFDMDLVQINSRYPDMTLNRSRGFYTKTDKDGNDRSNVWRLLTTPWHWILMATFFLSAWHHFHWSIVLMLAVCGVVLCGILWSLIMVSAIRRWRNKTEPERMTTSREREKKVLDWERSHLIFSLEPLVCEAESPMDGRLRSLPKTHQTIYIRYQALKGQLCRPFRR